VKEGVQGCSGGAERGGLRVGILHLTNDIPFPKDKTFQTGGDAEEMTGSFVSAFLNEVASPFGDVLFTPCGKEKLFDIFGRLVLWCREVEFGAVTGGEQDTFGVFAEGIAQVSEGVREHTRNGEGKAFADFNRGGLVG